MKSELFSPNIKVFQPQRLTPLLNDEIRAFIYTTPEKLTAYVKKYGSPLNLIWPENLHNNLTALRTALQQLHRHLIFYAVKVNKSQALLESAAKSGSGADVSSLYEMRAARKSGIPYSKICASGPSKTSIFLTDLITHDACISIDSTEEFEEIKALIAHIQPAHQVRVLLRYRPSFLPISRFGMKSEDLSLCLDKLASLKKQCHFLGFHFHLSGYDCKTRIEAIRELHPMITRAQSLGIKAQIMNIGGGLPVQYVDQHKYQAYLKEHSPADYDHKKPPLSFYPYGGELNGAQWLSRLLLHSYKADFSLADYFNQQKLTLALEPGRSLVDQCAITVFRVTRVKLLSRDRWVIFVEGSSFSACETWFSSEFLVDPVLIAEQAGPHRTCLSCQAFIAGHSCLDEDIISHRFIHFPMLPQAGDFLVYSNTAGYQMDLLENRFHRHPVPQHISLFKDQQA